MSSSVGRAVGKDWGACRPRGGAEMRDGERLYPRGPHQGARPLRRGGRWDRIPPPPHPPALLVNSQTWNHKDLPAVGGRWLGRGSLQRLAARPRRSGRVTSQAGRARDRRMTQCDHDGTLAATLPLPPAVGTRQPTPRL